MGLFTAGNLLTFGIVILVLILYRHLDRQNRTLDKVRKYADRLKEDLAAFVAEREGAVKDYGIDLQVKQDSAKELMKRLQITDKELAEKAEAVARIDERLNAYDASLGELFRMTGRVEENLNRIRDESAFVEGVNKRVGELRGRLEETERGFSSLELRFQQENTAFLEKTAEAFTAGVRSQISDLSASAETIGRQVDEHREAVKRVEQNREESLARDMETVNRTLKTAVEQAALRADRMEEAALVKLKEKAQERIKQLQAAEVERLKTCQEQARARVAEIQNSLKELREEWKTGKGEAAALEKKLEDIKTRTEEVISGQEKMLLGAAEEMKREALEVTAARLEEYRAAQTEDLRRLESLSNDSRSLDGELRRYMADTIEKVRTDFGIFAEEAAGSRRREAAGFRETADSLKGRMKELEDELTALRDEARGNVSEKLRIFERDFYEDINRRGGEIDKRLEEWRGGIEERLSALAAEADERRRETGERLGGEMEKALDAEKNRIAGELETLKADAEAFEENIRERMNVADESLNGFRGQLERNLAEAGDTAALSIKAEIGRYAITASENIKQHERDLDGKLRTLSDFVENRNTEISLLVDNSRKNVDEAREDFSSHLKDLDKALEEGRLKIRDLASESEERISQVRGGIKEAEQRIRQFLEESRLIGRAEELKRDLERDIEDLRGDMDRLDQRKAEADQLAVQFVQIKRLEDEVNNKMYHFMSEKRRIEQMESDFNRLLQTSKAVEEKLLQVTNSDDTLQAVQVHIRGLEEALAGTEERFQRVEKKNAALEATNEGIARNFQALQETEKSLEEMEKTIGGYAREMDSIRVSIETLAGENEKAKEAAEKLSILDGALKDTEERIREVQTAREWIARLETRLEELNREAQEKLKLVGNLLKGDSPAPRDKGAPAIGDRETIVRLARQGWTVQQIAKAMKISRGEVELILETAPRE
ncbi:MAG: hypothetical protein LBL43_00985 [Treponema sp.]|jgi:chromosome segregation ATPase|nr:hypothetical protein [Treponema sp.]